MRILFLNYEYPPLGGGAANATAYLLREFSHMPDIEVDLVTSSLDDQYHCEKVSDTVLVHRLPIGKNAKNLHFQSAKDLLMYTWRAYFFSKKLLKSNTYDVVHAFFTVPCGAIAWKLWREFHVPYIVSLRGSDVPGYSDRFTFIYPVLRPITRLIWNGAAAVISNSKGLKTLALETNAQQLIGIIPNGVDTEHFSAIDRSLKNPQVPLHLTLGASRVTDRKGIRFLIEAIDMLRDKRAFLLKVVGDGNAKERLEQMVRDLRLESQVTFVGRVPREETLPYYQEADIFVLPSLNEGMSNAMLEALSCGLPIIATDTGGSDELVTEGVNGYIIKQSDAKDIARVLKLLAEDASMRLMMGQKSRELAESMSWKNVATQYAHAYANAKNKK